MPNDELDDRLLIALAQAIHFTACEMIKRGEVDADGASAYVEASMADYAKEHGITVCDLRDAIGGAMERAPDNVRVEVLALESRGALRGRLH